MSYCVYMHTTPSGKRYIGVTMQELRRRWSYGHGYEQCPAFYKAIKKYGWKAIQHTILLDGLTKEEAEYWERFFISLFRTMDSRYGYNCETGGSLGKQVSEETRRKHSERQANGQAYWCGRQFTEEHRKRLSEAMATRIGENHPMYGKHHSVEARLKISEGGKGLKRSEETRRKMSESKKKRVINLDTKEVFESIDAAAEKYDISRCCIGDCCRGRQKTAAGYHWAYLDQQKQERFFRKLG